jgi:tricorn protease
MIPQIKIFGFALFMAIGLQATAQGFEGYYQNTIVFLAEGDIWKVPIQGGLAQRLTTHVEEERSPRISPDGKTLVYTASYEGPQEVYTMALDGSVPARWTYSMQAVGLMSLFLKNY